MVRSSIITSAPPLFAAALALAGCDGRTPPTQKGEISDGTFIYKCVGSSDALCDDGAITPEGFPPIALDSEFSVDFKPSPATNSDGSDVFSYIDTVAPERLEIVGDLAANPPTLQARATGFTALVARGDVAAFDFLHVEVVPVDALDVALVGGGSNVTGSIGMDTFTIAGASSNKLRATMRAKDGALLGGSLPCAWSSTNPSVVAITTSPTDNFITIATKSAGKATMTVTISEHQVQFPITVTMP